MCPHCGYKRVFTRAEAIEAGLWNPMDDEEPKRNRSTGRKREKMPDPTLVHDYNMDSGEGRNSEDGNYDSR